MAMSILSIVLCAILSFRRPHFIDVAIAIFVIGSLMIYADTCYCFNPAMRILTAWNYTLLRLRPTLKEVMERPIHVM